MSCMQKTGARKWERLLRMKVPERGQPSCWEWIEDCGGKGEIESCHPEKKFWREREEMLR